MNNEKNNLHIRQKYNKMRNWCHWKLAVTYMINCPFLFFFSGSGDCYNGCFMDQNGFCSETV